MAAGRAPKRPVSVASAIGKCASGPTRRQVEQGRHLACSGQQEETHDTATIAVLDALRHIFKPDQ
jgi:hypothetical protein